MACDISPDIPKPSIPPLQRRTNRPPFTPVAAISAEANIYLIGGSIPELEPTTKKYYNISLVFPPDGVLIATHLKTPLFSIDIPGKLKFKESNVLSSDNELTVIDRPEYRKIGLAIVMTFISRNQPRSRPANSRSSWSTGVLST